MPRTLMRIAALLVAALLVGWLTGRPWQALAVAALAALAWQAWKLQRLLSRLEGRLRVAAIEGGGAWNEGDRYLHRDQQDIRAAERRLVGMLRAYRELVHALRSAEGRWWEEWVSTWK